MYSNKLEEKKTNILLDNGHIISDKEKNILKLIVIVFFYSIIYTINSTERHIA